MNYYWYMSKHNPPYDKSTGDLYGYAEEPEYGFIEKYDLRFARIETWESVCNKNT